MGTPRACAGAPFVRVMLWWPRGGLWGAKRCDKRGPIGGYVGGYVAMVCRWLWGGASLYVNVSRLRCGISGVFPTLAYGLLLAYWLLMAAGLLLCGTWYVRRTMI